jgi:hypothetical protein
MTNKKNRYLWAIGLTVIIAYIVYRLRNGNVVVAPQNTDTTGRSANLTGANYANNSIATVSTVNTPSPVFSENPNIAFGHIRLQISNAGTFNIVIKKNGQPFQSDTVTGPMFARYLSNYFENDGATYTVDVNGLITTIVAPTNIQTRTGWIDETQNDEI